jgi:vacuolar-type H+-ATPase subunit I/STV1
MTMKHIKEITDAMASTKPYAYIGVLEERVKKSDQEIVRLNGKLATVKDKLAKQAEFWDEVNAGNKKVAGELKEGTTEKRLYSYITEIYQFHIDFVNNIVASIEETE